MSFVRKHSIRLVSLLFIVSMLYIPMMIHPPTSPQRKEVVNQPLIASERLDRISDLNNTEIPIRNERKNFVYEPIIK